LFFDDIDIAVESEKMIVADSIEFHRGSSVKIEKIKVPLKPGSCTDRFQVNITEFQNLKIESLARDADLNCVDAVLQVAYCIHSLCNMLKVDFGNAQVSVGPAGSVSSYEWCIVSGLWHFLLVKPTFMPLANAFYTQARTSIRLQYKLIQLNSADVDYRFLTLKGEVFKSHKEKLAKMTPDVVRKAGIADRFVGQALVEVKGGKRPVYQFHSISCQLCGRKNSLQCAQFLCSPCCNKRAQNEEFVECSYHAKAKVAALKKRKAAAAPVDDSPEVLPVGAAAGVED
jgi:hypothetical protein